MDQEERDHRTEEMNMPNELPAGPELDRLIAEKVMGWTWHDDESLRLGGLWVNESGVGAEPPSVSDQEYMPSTWQPSTSIAHAWEVVERMEPQLRIQPGGHTPYYAIMRSQGGYVAGYWTDINWMTSPADTAPLAICRAALQALRYKQR